MRHLSVATARLVNALGTPAHRRDPAHAESRQERTSAHRPIPRDGAPLLAALR